MLHTYVHTYTYIAQYTPYRLTDITPLSSGLFFMTCCLLFGILIGLLTIAISFPRRAVCLCVFAAYQATLCEAPQLPVLGRGDSVVRGHHRQLLLSPSSG